MITIPIFFLQHACDILGDTDNVFSTSKIFKLSVRYSIKYDIEISHTDLSTKAPNKIVALYENIHIILTRAEYT